MTKYHKINSKRDYECSREIEFCMFLKKERHLTNRGCVWLYTIYTGG
jgi:hypothetical protein